MVATILKKVTNQGIEAAKTVSIDSVSVTTNSSANANASADTSTNVSANAVFFKDVKQNVEPQIVNINNININPHDNVNNKVNSNVNNNVNANVEIEDGILETWSKFASDAFTSTRDTIYTASDEASKQMIHLTSSIYSPSSNKLSALRAAEVKEDAGIGVGVGVGVGVGISQSSSTQKSNENIRIRAGTSNPRKWFMRDDPYNIVTGRSGLPPTHHRKSVMAVRNLLELVDTGKDGDDENDDDDDDDDENDNENNNENDDELTPLWQGKKSIRRLDEQGLNSFGSRSDASLDVLDEESHNGTFTDLSNNVNATTTNNSTTTTTRDEFSTSGRPKRTISKAETASKLSEGTVRAMRDMALNEALELHHALRFWTARLENPFLFHLEFGPWWWWWCWWSKDIHNHSDVGQKVSQLQAVLARRCSSIGQLQQHLWRAGWSSGVEQWGILGQGEWAMVVGGHGLIDENQSFAGFDDRRSPKGKRKGNKKDYYAESHLFVKNVRGGRIVRNDPALAAWSIDAIRVVRDQLYSAGSGRTPLPKFENWPREFRHFEPNNSNSHSQSENNNREGSVDLWDSMISIEESGGTFDVDDENADIPIWATYDVGESDLVINTVVTDERTLVNPSSDVTSPANLEDSLPLSPEPQFQDYARSKPIRTQQGDIVISDLGLMAAEVTEILNSMEKCMEQQRRRRLDKLKPPPRILRNWYIVAIGIPVAGYLAYNLTKENRGVKLAKEFYQQTISFCAEHISEPVQSIYRELFTGRVDVADHKAREGVIDILQKMIKSWLDEEFPNMPERERIDKATRMDMSLIESQKEYSIKNILEINNIYRLSLIEMQFIKKEMMNALVAIDELMGSNEINMQLAAMTPALLLASSFKHLFQKVYYAFLKLGKSKEETYASFRHIILDIERLLVMRDNPPDSIPPLATGVNAMQASEIELYGREEKETNRSSQVLTSDDLGMLMLLVHECRVILWQDRKRFSRSERRNMSEDLAELAGERGAVSVHQQLRIIARMCRTYSFLKVISAGIPFTVIA